MANRLTGRDIILGVLENMREGLEPLLYTTLAPGVYDVYLHSADYERLAGILSLITAEAQAGLDKALSALNQAARNKRWKLPLSVPFAAKEESATVKFQNPAGVWALAFHQSLDEEIKPGELLIESTLALPVRPEIGVGMGTKKIRTIRSGGASRVVDARYEQSADVAPLSVPSELAVSPRRRAFARFTWRDKRGPQTYLMTTNQIVAGRGGTDHWVDLRLDASSDISREHFRLRREEKTGEFFIRDLSTYGTALNGRKLPSSLADDNGAKRDINLEVALPRQARIELAGTLTIEFEALEVNQL